MSLRYALLAALASKPRTGYELSRKVEGSIGFFWNATHQQIYKELKGLDSEGWVSAREVQQDEKPDKKVYKLTATGLRELKKWIGEKVELPPSKDALLIKIFAGHLVEPEVLLKVLEESIEERRARLATYREILKTYFSDPEAVSEPLQFQYLTLRQGILFEEAWLKWAGETRAFIVSKNRRP